MNEIAAALLPFLNFENRFLSFSSVKKKFSWPKNVKILGLYSHNARSVENKRFFDWNKLRNL